ncbi:hypothetical protein KC19_7G144900 [Ceratodon purpureus]|uniref:TF-B3 domain-containing protein n=1 Tax=Ceratodon purpureus TaxID=3225 RepID=A0A8T0H6J5_CERPU|nr:hypothetical protein KC19_7G144900 [Ceratodon purpureus]
MLIDHFWFAAEIIMRPPTNFGVREEVKNEFSWGKARKRSCMKVESKLVHPKVVRWAEEYNHKTPYFIKIIGNSSDYTRHFENHGAKLTLPIPFTREHYLKLDREVTLEDAVNGRTWKVSFQANGYKTWSHGWPAFANDNNLHRGNMVLFALVAHSHFHFTVFNDQGCQIIHPSIVKQETNPTSQEKCVVNRSSFHLPSCPKYYARRVKLKQEFQEDEIDTSHEVKDIDERTTAQNIGQDKLSRAALVHDFQQPKRKFKASATSAAQNNHKICIHMGFPCGVHHPEQKPKVQPASQTLTDQCEDHSGLLDQCQKGLEQVHLSKCNMDTNHPLVEERTLSGMEMSEPNSESGTILGASHVQSDRKAHLDPIWFTFLSKRRVVTNEEKREAKAAASKYSRALRKPNSITVMKEFHVYRDFIMELPKALLLLRGTVEFPQPALTLVDSVGRSWEMQWYASGRHRLTLVPKDWALFAVHHFLEEGDRCVFEATDIEALTILVRIFRVVDIHDNLSTDSIYTHYSVKFSL